MSDNDRVEEAEAFLSQAEETSSVKEKVAVQSLRGDVTQEDASRSNLHYGEQEDAGADRTRDDATPSSSDVDAGLSQEAQTSGGQQSLDADKSGVANAGAPQQSAFDQSTSRGDGQSDTVLSQEPAPESQPFSTPRSNADPLSVETFSTENAAPSERPQEEQLSQPLQTGEETQFDQEDNPQQAKASPPPNHAPTELSLDPVELAENDAGAIVGQLSVIDPNASDVHEFSVSDDRFEVVEGQIKLKPGVFLDHEQEASLRFDVTATDADGASYTESFEVFVGDVNEAPTSVSIDQSHVAVDQAGAVVGQINVVDPDQEANYEFTLSDDRFEVSEGQLKLRDGISLTEEDAGDLAIEVMVTDQGGETVSQTFDLGVVETASVNVSSGFHASYFDVDHKLSKLDQIDWTGEATHEEVVGEINYTNSRESFWEGGSKDTFGARITGNIEVEEGGTFDFFIGGDDGVILLVNGEEVIDNDGLHGFRTRSGEIELEPGTHSIEVRYFENYGHAGLKLEWEGPGTDGRELVTAPEVDDLQTINGMPIALELDVSAPEATGSDQISHQIEGLPPGTVVEAGDMSVEAGPEGTADISGMDLSLLTVTTPIEFTGQVSAQIVTTTDIGDGNQVSVTADLELTVSQADLTPPSVQMETGFRASYFDVDHKLSKLDQIDWTGEATHEEVVGEINYTNSRESFWEGGSKDTFGARITGNIEVEEGGTFDFFIGGDDGVILLVNGEEVIDNDGLHGFRTRSGEIELEPGTHSIEVRYFENYGHAGLKLEWEGPGTDGRELVTAVDDLAVPQNGMIAIGIGDDNLSDAATVQMSGLPADTILMSGDQVAVSDGSEIDLTGWDLSLLELAPPPGFEGTISGEITTTDTAFNGQMVSGSDVFSIDVGDVDNGQNQSSDGETSDAWASYESADASSSWVDAADDQGAGDEQNEDVMAEEVEENHGSEQNHEMNETYERQDW
ncbi:PA14 domain-containing protein [uncultured Roseobacter sp.]|uniref:PA14 domain-containing protein n=1 Tax=uncultured Roseobacter sp. TaxID=114847 RepID=UPI00262DA65C|nr:PA14 domain-containing protein [uncultured Roseobacter sp.]